MSRKLLVASALLTLALAPACKKESKPETEGAGSAAGGEPTATERGAVSGPAGNPHAGLKARNPHAGLMGGNPHAGMMGGHRTPSGAARVDLTGIEKAEGGYTVAELFAQKDKVSGKEVSVRGKVTKVNERIMGKNWIHLRDGTGAAGANDLVVTTAPEVKVAVGNTILIKGKAATDKDFGAGYKYALIVEDAAVQVE